MNALKLIISQYESLHNYIAIQLGYSQALTHQVW